MKDNEGRMENEPQFNENTENIPSLEEAEAKDLSIVWQKLGSGIERELPTDLEAAKTQMWEDTEQAFIEQIIPHLQHFSLDVEREEKIRTATDPTEKAKWERELADYYQSQLQQEKSGWGTTPALSKQTGWSLDCVGSSAVMIIALQRAGIHANPGTVWGHKVVLWNDSEGKRWYYDTRNGNKGEIVSKASEQHGARLYELSQDEAAQIGIPYRRLVELSAREGFLWSMMGNIDVLRERGHVSQSKPEVETDRLYEENRDSLELRNWEELRGKILPDNQKWEEWINHDQGYVEAEHQLHEETQALIHRVLEKTLNSTDASQEEKEALSRAVFGEVLTHKDAVWAYLQGTEEKLPALSEQITKLLTHLREALASADVKLREHLLAQISKRLHPKQ